MTVRSPQQKITDKLMVALLPPSSVHMFVDILFLDMREAAAFRRPYRESKEGEAKEEEKGESEADA